MPLEQVTVTLTSFEKLEVLRSELKAREEELQTVERDLRSALRTVATHRYLGTVSPFYKSRPEPQEARAVAELESRRRGLFQVIQAIRAEMPKLESAAVNAQPASGLRRNRFEPLGQKPRQRGR